MRRNLAILLGFSFLSSLVYGQTPDSTAANVSNDTTTSTTTTSTVTHAPAAASTADQNKRAGEAFLATNKNMPGVVTTASGLEYKIIDPGNGPKPTKNDVVTVDYEGKLINGQVFDSSYQRGQPATFPLSQVIEGWQEGLQMMHTGSTWEFFIPAKLAYGEAGAPGAIGPNETLLFKVHLIAVKPG